MQHVFYERYKVKVPGYNLLGEPSSKYDFVVYYGKRDPLVDLFITPLIRRPNDYNRSDDYDDPPTPKRQTLIIKIQTPRSKIPKNVHYNGGKNNLGNL